MQIREKNQSKTLRPRKGTNLLMMPGLTFESQLHQPCSQNSHHLYFCVSAPSDVILLFNFQFKDKSAENIKSLETEKEQLSLSLTSTKTLLEEKVDI